MFSFSWNTQMGTSFKTIFWEWFLLRRLSEILLVAIIAWLIYRYFEYEIISYNWFIKVSVLLYIAFYILFRLFSWDKVTFDFWFFLLQLQILYSIIGIYIVCYWTVSPFHFWINYLEYNEHIKADLKMLASIIILLLILFLQNVVSLVEYYFLGDLSFEIYIMHGLFLELLISKFSSLILYYTPFLLCMCRNIIYICSCYFLF